MGAMMIGHQTIIAARRAHLKPEAIFFEVDLATPPRFYFDDPENALRLKMHAQVELSISEPWRTYDLRFVTGCRIFLQADRWSDDLTDLAERMVQQGATHVIVCCIRDNDDILEYFQGEWIAYRSI